MPARRRLAPVAALLLLAAAVAAVEPPRPRGEEFHFVVLGDSQFHQPNKFNQIIDEVVHLSPAFVIQVGDMISGGVASDDLFRAQWRRFRAQIAPLEAARIPFVPVPGNHDVYDDQRELGGEDVYREVWGDTYYSFDYRNAHFVILNTDAAGIAQLGDAQMAWLRRDLAAATAENIFVFSHRPTWAMTADEELHALFVEHGVSAVICGHMHHYNYHERDGIPYVMTVSATRMGTPFPMAAGSFHHFLQVAVRGDDVDIAVIEAGHVYPTDIVAFQDNQDLYLLQRRFFADRRIAFDALPQTDGGRRVTLEVSNPTNQELTVYFEWQLPNERWSVEPLKGRRLVLPPGAEDVPVSFALRRRFADPPEAFPTCVARALFLTSDGDVVQSEHRADIVASLETD